MTRTLFAGIAALSLFAACDNKPADKTAAPVAAVTPPPVATPPAEVAVPPTDLTFEDAVAKFDAATQHLVWVLPPGIIAKGPYAAHVEIAADGKPEFKTDIPLTAETPASGSRPEYPAGAVVLRLSTDATYPDRLKEIQGKVEGVKARLGPGHGELNVNSDFKTEIAEAYRKPYCVEKKMPPITIYLEYGGSPSTLQALPIGGGQSILQQALLAGCPKAQH